MDYNVIELPKDTMFDILDSDRLLQDEVIDTGRWSEFHEIVFNYQGATYKADYSCGLTEMQDERPWDDEEVVPCTEVEATQVTRTEWRAKKVEPSVA